MKIIIAGVGNTGSFVAQYLSEEKSHDVTIIDNNSKVVTEITDNYSVGGIVGDSTDFNTLEDADIKNTQLFISCSPSDDVNIMSCHLASLMGVTTNIARLKSSNYLDYGWEELFRLKTIPVDGIIAPEREMINSIKDLIKYKYLNLTDFLNFSSANIKVLAFICGEDTISLNKSVLDVNNLAKEKNIVAKIIGIFRRGHFFIPKDADVIQKDDRIFISTIVDDIEDAYLLFYNFKESEMKLLESQAPNIIITGDNPFIKFVAISLSSIYKIKVITDKKTESENNFGVELEKYNIQVIIDDISKPQYRDNYLKSKDDVIILLYNNDKDAIFNSLLLKYQQLGNIFCFLRNSQHEDFLFTSGISHVLVPNNFIMSSILSSIRRGIIYSIYSLYNTAEIIELEVANNSLVVGQTVADIESIGNILVANIINEQGNIVLVNPTTRISSNHTVIIVVLRTHIKEIENLFSHKIGLNNSII
jgi:trk system potassium uptake protein TrkA